MSQLERSPVSLDLGRVRTRCEHVRAAFRAAVDWVSLRPLSGEAIARWCGLKGPLCRRVLAAVQHHGESADLVRILPGVEGLTLFVDALARQGCPASRTEPARAAIRAFAELLHEGGGSQRCLVTAVREALAPGALDSSGASDALDVRRRLYEAARDLTGACSRATVVLSIVHRAKRDSAELDSCGALGQLGYRARHGAAPLVARHYAPAGVADSTSGAADEADLQELLGTPNLEVERTRVDERLVLSTYDGGGSEQPVDLWTGPVRNEAVVRLEPGEENGYGSLAAIRTPARHLVHDLWVELPLATASVLRSSVHRTSPDAMGSIDYRRWYDRLPGEPAVLLPGADLGAGVERIHARHAEVVEHCFTFAGLDRERFVCHRCVVEYPVWMAIYRLTLEFASP